MAGDIQSKPEKNKRGRPVGAVNKIPSMMRGLVVEACKNLDAAGLSLSNWAMQNPDDFYTKVFTKILPKPVEITGEDGGPVDVVVRAAELSDDQLASIIGKTNAE